MSETASAFLLACRPAVASRQVSLGLSLSHRCIVLFLSPSLSLFLACSFCRFSSAILLRRLSSTLRRETSPPPRRTVARNATIDLLGIVYSRCIHRFPSSRCTFRGILPLSRIGNSDDSERYVVLLNVTEKQSGWSILSSLLSSLIARKIIQVLHWNLIAKILQFVGRHRILNMSF